MDGRINDPFDIRAEPPMAFLRTGQMGDETRCLRGGVSRVGRTLTCESSSPIAFNCPI
jgi:hypothetical protein